MSRRLFPLSCQGEEASQGEEYKQGSKRPAPSRRCCTWHIISSSQQDISNTYGTLDQTSHLLPTPYRCDKLSWGDGELLTEM